MEVVKTYVHLLGDSTLDNVHWLINRESDIPNAKKQCIEGQLQATLGEDYQVVNHAFDGFTTNDVLGSSNVGAVLGYNSHYLTARGVSGFVKPLETLQAKISENNEAIHYVVISVGGNDFRVKLLQPWSLLSEIPHVQERYLEIVQKVQAMGKANIKPILMFQYRTDARNRPYRIYTILGALGYFAAAINTFAVGAILFSAYRLMKNKVSRVVGTSGMFIGAALLYISHRQLSLRVTKEIFMGKHVGIAVFGAALERFYQPMIKMALEKKIPIVDLPNLFDPKNPDNYISEIEPSAKGGEVIVGHLRAVVVDYAEAQRSTDTSFKDWTIEAL